MEGREEERSRGGGGSHGGGLGTASNSWDIGESTESRL